MREQSMSELDNVVCRCITSGINCIEDISFVLALDVRIVEAEIAELLLSGILEEKDGMFYLTENGSLLYKRNMKVEKVKEEFLVAVNAVTGEWSVSLGERLSKVQISKDTVCLQPLRTVVKHEIEENRELFTALQREHSVNIVSIQLLDYIAVNYQEETILFYRNDAEQILFALYNNEKEELDISLGKVLIERYQRRELLEIMQAESVLRMLDQKFMQDNPHLSKVERNYKYCRNKEIRELFKNIFDIAQKSVFLVSPWIDNNNYVMTEEVLSKMEYALKERGIKITIGYGYLSPEKMEKKRSLYVKEKENGSFYDKDWETEIMAQKLKARFGKYKNFTIFYIGTHEKILSYDETYTLIGSYNLLSYDGGEQHKYKGFSFRYEGGVMIEDAEFARSVWEEFERLL